MLYRVAIQVDAPSLTWQWKSTALSSLSALFQLLRVYRAIPQNRLRIFTGASKEELSEQIAQENRGLGSQSVTAGEFLKARKLRPPEATGGARAGDMGRVRAAATLQTSVWSSEAGSGFFGKAASALERRRTALEDGMGCDHDLPYSFSLPPSTRQVLAWVRLLARVQRGELRP